MANIQPIDNKKHANVKVKQDPSLSHTKNNHLVPVSVFELAKVQQEYPVAFIKDEQTGRFHLVALLGLKPEENLYYNEQGWNASYIPQQLMFYPFSLTENNNNEQHVLCLNFDSDRVSETQGEPLFNAPGQGSEFLEKINKAIGDSINQFHTTKAFVEKLAELELLAQQSLSIRLKGQDEFNLTGLYVIDENKLNNLSNEKYLELKTLGYMGPIYACMFAMHNVANLVKMKSETEQV